MIDTNEVKIRCPKCNKLICSMEKDANPEGIHFWCSRCKKKFDINNVVTLSVNCNIDAEKIKIEL
jgi:phage FluMu protein Com